MFESALIVVLAVAVLALSLVALSQRRKLRSINLFRERSAVRTAYRDIVELLADAAQFTKEELDIVFQLADVQEQLHRSNRVGGLVPEHLVRQLQQHVRAVLAVDNPPEPWTRTLLQGLDREIDHASGDWIQRALVAWRDELQRQLRGFLAERRERRMAEAAV